MKARKISVEDAREYFAHPTQQRGSGLTPDDIDNSFEFWARGGVCVYLHPWTWPHVWMAHVAVKPNAWGKVAGHVRAILAHVWAEKEPDLLVAQVNGRNRAGVALVRRIGGFEIGTVKTRVGPLVLMGWQHG